jgi:hypothetical protein
MEAKKATLITISSIIIAAGTIGLIIRAQKKRLYSAILTKIIQASPVRNSDWQAYFDINFHKAYNPAQYSKYTTFNAQKIAEKLRDTFYGEWYQLGMGTKEDEMYALLSQIPDGVRLSQVSDEYQKKYEANLLSEIRSELDVKDFDKVIEIVSRKKSNSLI